MAFTDLGSLASGGSTSNNQGSLTVATTASCSAGELVVVVVSVDNQATGGGDDLSTSGVTIGGVALTKGRQNATNLAAQAGASVSLWWGVLAGTVSSGSNIIASFTTAATSDATALSARRFSKSSGATVAVEATNAGTATTTNPGSLNATTANLPCLRIRAIGCEYDSTQALTVTAAWTVWAEGASAASGTVIEQVIETEHRISTGTGDASAPTLGSACDSASVYVAFKEVYTLAGESSSYSLTGSAATFSIPALTEYLPAGIADSFNPWGPRRGRPYWTWFSALHIPVPVTLTAAGGSYTITGTAAGLILPGGLAAAAGSYALTGSDAALTVTGGVDYLPAGMTGSYVPWGRPFPVNLRTGTGRPLSEAAAPVPPDTDNLPAGAVNWFNPWGRKFPINLRTGIGRPLLAGVLEPVVLTAAAGSYTLTGSAASLALRLTANSGSYTVSGSAAALALRFVAGSGAYTLTGAAAALALRLTAGSGAYTLTGADAQLAQSGSITLSCAAGAYTLTGFAASFLGVTPPIEQVPSPSPGGVGGRPLYKRLKLKKKRKRDECEELLEYLAELPPFTEMARAPELPSTQSLLDCIPPAALPQVRAAINKTPVPDDDDDEEAIALLLEFL